MDMRLFKPEFLNNSYRSGLIKPVKKDLSVQTINQSTIKPINENYG